MSHVRFVGCGDAFGSGGRFNTCILVDVPSCRFAIDFGASSLIALKAQGIDHNSISTIICTHIHGDHCGGVPFLLMDAMLGAKRTAPLTIAGPKGIHAGILAMRDALFPGMERMIPKFDLEFVEIETASERSLGPINVTTFPAIHTPETNPMSVRVAVDGKIIAYTGDGEWTPDMPALARGADLLIAECYFYEKPVKFHLNYPTLKEHWHELDARRIVLTHLSPEMIGKADLIAEICAYDGMVVGI
jgi:ribonuclease BN (tRNA processing enzyme)